MAKRRSQGSPRSGKRKRAKKPRGEAVVPKIYSHPRFGNIPLLPVHWTTPEGDARGGYRFDPDHRPPLPEDAVVGDPHRQLHRSAFDVPRYFYVDQERSCVQCRAPFTFSGREQKHWYETLKFPFESVAIRCVRCRRQRRSDKALHHAVDDSKRQLADDPDNAGAQLALAEALVSLHERLGRGDLHQAIAAARKARSSQSADSPPLSSGWVADTLYWEAAAQALLERTDHARTGYTAFLAQGAGRKRRDRRRKAAAWLAAHPTPG